MTFTKILLPVAVAGLVGACAQQPTTITQPPVTAGQCDAAGARFALGGTANAALVEEARKRSGALMARTIGPGQVVTMEYNAQRLNLDINTAYTVMNVRCG